MSSTHDAKKRTVVSCSLSLVRVSLTILQALPVTNAIHHMKRSVTARQSGSGIALVVTNMCSDTIYPAIVSQAGTGPSSTGFELTTGSNMSQTVSSDWQGRVWGRTNCTFGSDGYASGGGTACDTGDCGQLSCKAAGQIPTTLAEFTLNGGSSQSFYDISLVDGYNLPLAIVLLGESSLPANQGNPSCVASVGDLAAANFDPYSGNQEFLGTTSQDPLPFDSNVTSSQASSWCPWDLQMSPPTAPGNGVYPYPDTNIARPAFNPCLSACAKYNTDSYCCTGSYDSPSSCSSNYYSSAAKAMCPDAYSFAFDDTTSTFITQQGPGFQVVFCPGGRSTNIKASSSGSSTSSAASSSGSFRSALGSTHPTLDMLVGTSGRALVVSLVTVLTALVA